MKHWTSDVSENEPKFSIGQVVRFPDHSYATRECPHCGQDYDEVLPRTFTERAVSRIDGAYWPDGKGSWYGSYYYLLSDNRVRKEEELTAV
jgi:hypothetical protein